MASIQRLAPAKLNLTLDVLAQRDDGYHDLAMVMQSVALGDEISITTGGPQGIRVASNLPFLPTGPTNLAAAAAIRLCEDAGVDWNGIDITLKKVVPVCAGLGGGSSDAAAVLVALNELLGLGRSQQQLIQLAAQVGSDVPYCVMGGTALARGRGEILSPLPKLPQCHAVICKPPFPVFTPALDTAVGWERTTVQLVDITVEKGAYSFGFEKLDRWVKLCLGCGIERFEIAHLYSQWGAEHCPKIMATVVGEYRRIFGWESDAVGPEYAGFLNAFLPALTAHLEELGLRKEQVVFHISDEPSADHLPQYKACREQVQGLLEGYTIMDALSDFSFYQQGVCQNPVVATNHTTPFLEHKVENLWVYYCVSQNYQVSNRFMAMPSARTRIIGTQFYKYRIAGFLHWGFNFYNSQYSLKHIDPFAVTDADGAFPAGDPFLVYPGEGGEAWDSLRLQVFYDAICDLRAFELLESLAGREFVMELLEGGLQREITFFDYPHEAGYLLALRARVNEEIKKRVNA